MARYMIGGLMTCGMVLAPGSSLAQAIGSSASIIISPQLERTDVAGARIEPAFRSEPAHIGILAIQPALSVIGGYSTNVFNRPEAESDATLFIMPTIQMKADFLPHRLDFVAQSTLRRFATFKSEDSEEFDITVDGALEVSSTSQITATADFANLIEPRSSVGTVADAAEPVSYRRLDTTLGLDLELGRIRVAPSANYQMLDYAPLSRINGTPVEQSFRDTDATRATLRISYDFSDMFAAFASGSISAIHSGSAPRDVRRDARSTVAMVGLKGSLTPLLAGEIGVGYQTRSYELPIYRDFSGMTFAADLQWFVTPMMTLRLQADRSFQNSGFREVAGILTDTAKLTGYYDPLRNLRLSLTASYENGRYREVDTRTRRQTARLSAEYRMSPLISIGGYFTLIHQNVDGTPLVGTFTSASAGIGVSVTP